MRGRDFPERSGVDRGAEEIERLYRDFRPLLIGTMIRKFEVPPADAETLLHDVFVAFLTVDIEVVDPRSWLVATACNAARAWRRSEARYNASSIVESEPVTEDHRAILDTLFLRDALTTLPERAREAVRLRFFEQLTYPEIAANLNISVKSAEKLVATNVARLRKAYVTAKS
ncbi:MAG: sigma-70 family RNA polymerase sigma factor [Acidobacteriota bacterium]